MVESNTFYAKCPILTIFRKCHKWWYKTLKNSASIVLALRYTARCHTTKFQKLWPYEIYLGSQKYSNTLCFEKNWTPFTFLQGISCYIMDYDHVKIIIFFQIWGRFSSRDLVIPFKFICKNISALLKNLKRTGDRCSVKGREMCLWHFGLTYTSLCVCYFRTNHWSESDGHIYVVASKRLRMAGGIFSDSESSPCYLFASISPYCPAWASLRSASDTTLLVVLTIKLLKSTERRISVTLRYF